MAGGSEPVLLVAGPLEVDLVPAIGGSVAAFRHRGTDIFRPLSAADREAGNVLGVGMFPMVPYANRIAGNAFEFRGRRYRVQANNPPERFNVHGTGWHRAWTVAEQDAGGAVMALVEAGEPWRYRAEQHVALDRDGLTVGLRLMNTGRQTMPFGFGLHPWFPRDSDVTLAFQATRFHPEGPEMVAGAPVTLLEPLDFAAARPLPSLRLNNDFGGWSGRAVLRFPSRGVELVISADPVFGHLMIYADPGRPFFCVEPQSNAACAFNRGDVADPQEGIVVLEPGQEVRGDVRFAVRALAD